MIRFQIRNCRLWRDLAVTPESTAWLLFVWPHDMGEHLITFHEENYECRNSIDDALRTMDNDWTDRLFIIIINIIIIPDTWGHGCVYFQ